MATYLLDVNVLVALAWPGHTHHGIASRWFVSSPMEYWATSPLTQCGFIRISSNPKAIERAIRAAEASRLLGGMTNHPKHQFWSDELNACDLGEQLFGRVRGYRQVTDAYLLGSCVARGAKLATFDEGIVSLVTNERERNAVEIIRG